MEDVKSILLEKLEAAEVVLAGIGEEFGEYAAADCTGFTDRIRQEGPAWMHPYGEMLRLKRSRTERMMTAYAVLEKLLENKDYFIVSIRKDDCIYDTGLRADRIVTPCGGYRFTQCEHGCSRQLFKTDQKLLREIAECMEGKRDPHTVQRPLCPVCKAGLVFNNTDTEQYVEEGYSQQWQHYMEWLQRTLNRRLCVLELGVGMAYPTVIRWPFEKIVFLNQKSNLFRVHSKLYYLTEEIQGRGYSLEEKPIDFLINRFV